jgi:hypothetical protein
MSEKPELKVVPEPITWRKLKRPKTWKPENSGEELVGYYLGQTIKDGRWGQYNVVMVAVPNTDGPTTTPYMASGSALIRAIDGGSVEVGMLVRIVYEGLKALDDDREMKLFEVYVGEGSLG